MKYCSGTFSGPKLFLCVPEIIVLGHQCTPEGHQLDLLKVNKIQNWGPCNNLSKVRTFLGTIGVICIFIKNFVQKAHHLVKLTKKDHPFEFSSEQLEAMEVLKAPVLESPALHAIDYTSSSPVILAVNTSYITVGYHLCQCNPDTPHR
jgi:hypothetical protein